MPGTALLGVGALSQKGPIPQSHLGGGSQWGSGTGGPVREAALEPMLAVRRISHGNQKQRCGSPWFRCFSHGITWDVCLAHRN